MKNIPLVLLASLLFVPPGRGVEPLRSEVLGVMERAADWQLAHPASWKADEWQALLAPTLCDEPTRLAYD